MGRSVKNESAAALACKNNPDFVLTQIPFDGFYESLYSGEMENQDEQDAEYYAGEHEENLSFPPELRLDASEYGEILFENTDYIKVERGVALAYAESYGLLMNEVTGLDLGLVYEGMVSPSFYNYGTDRLFCYIPRASVQKLFELSSEHGHKILAKLIAERCTSRSGFSSFYDNELKAWLEKPLADWDHNEIAILLDAVFAEIEGEGELRDFHWRMFYAYADGSGMYQDMELGRDWHKIEEKVSELREQKRADYESRMAGEGLPPLPTQRCDATPDMFKGGR